MEVKMKDILLSKVKEAVVQLEPSAEVILYGSRARHDFREYSDWDFLVLVDGPVDTARTDRIRRILFEIELDTDQIISSIIRSRQEWNSPRYSVVPLRKNVEREGIHI
jgi:predicted nucleotidyltransferase